jgi:hypothetical protein
LAGRSQSLAADAIQKILVPHIHCLTFWEKMLLCLSINFRIGERRDTGVVHDWRVELSATLCCAALALHNAVQRRLNGLREIPGL